MYDRLPREIIQLIYEFDRTHHETYTKCIRELEWNNMEWVMKTLYPNLYDYKEKEEVNPIIHYFRKEQCTRNNCNHQNNSTKKSYVLPFLFLEPKTKEETIANVCKDCYLESDIKILSY